MGRTAPSRTPLSYLGIKETNPPELWFYNHAPSTADSKLYGIGDIWIDNITSNAYMLMSKPQNIANWKQINGSGSTVDGLSADLGGSTSANTSGFIGLNGFGGIQTTAVPASFQIQILNKRYLSPFIVGDSESEYSTIQTAINAASSSGGIVLVRAGTYAGFSMVAGVDIQGIQDDGDMGRVIIDSTISANHTGMASISNLTIAPPTGHSIHTSSGDPILNIFNCNLVSTNVSTVKNTVATTQMTFKDCMIRNTSASPTISFDAGSTTPPAVILDRCSVLGLGEAFSIDGPAVARAQYCTIESSGTANFVKGTGTLEKSLLTFLPTSSIGSAITTLTTLLNL